MHPTAPASFTPRTYIHSKLIYIQIHLSAYWISESVLKTADKIYFKINIKISIISRDWKRKRLHKERGRVN